MDSSYLFGLPPKVAVKGYSSVYSFSCENDHEEVTWRSHEKSGQCWYCGCEYDKKIALPA